MSAGALLRAAAVAVPRRRRVALAALLSFGAVASAVGLMAASGYLIVRAAQQPPILTLTAVIVAVRAFALSRALLRYAERLASHDLALRVLGDLRARCYERLAPLVPAGLPGRRSGDLLTRFVGDVDTMQDLYVRALTPPLVALATVLVAGAAAAVVAPTVGLALAGTLFACAVLLPLATGLAVRGAARRQGPLRGELTTELVEALDGAAELSVLGQAPTRLRRLSDLDARLRRAATRDAVSAGLAGGLGTLVAGAAVFAVLMTAVPLVQDGRIDGVLLGLLVLLALASAEGIVPMGDAARRIGACAAAASRLEEITRAGVPVTDPDVPAALPVSGAIAVQDARVVLDERVVLDGLDLRLEPGRAIGVVGASGSGKTTLGHMLVRFLDPAGGRVTFGGVDVRAVAQDDLRSAVLLAEQDARVFATTIRENLLIADRGADDERLWSALQAVDLAAEVEAMPDGLDTDCGTDGDALSGGQRRRLLIARALVSRARFLVLDEPAAHLDAGAARALLARLVQEARDGRGVLVMGHSAASLAAFDEVHLLQAGRLTAAPVLAAA